MNMGKNDQAVAASTIHAIAEEAGASARSDIIQRARTIADKHGPMIPAADVGKVFAEIVGEAVGQQKIALEELRAMRMAVTAEVEYITKAVRALQALGMPAVLADLHKLDEALNNQKLKAVLKELIRGE